MKVHVRPERGKVVVSARCKGCGVGTPDMLRPCPICGQSVVIVWAFERCDTVRRVDRPEPTRRP